MEEIFAKYTPKEIEAKWYKFWLSKNYFRSEVSTTKQSFSIVIPPPNVTGFLHMGHALNTTLQDVLIRYKRMQGFNTLWLPGTDHAGIATQNVVEKYLAKKGVTRNDLGREKFIERVWEWKEKYGDTIITQLKGLGASCDWSKLRFTMDDGFSTAVREVFIRLYNEGLIYRNNYIINWCPRCQTALSDIEVDYKEVKGHLYYIKYPVKNSKEYVVVATTRPETMFGDTAVAIHPDDNRYLKFLGKTIILPIAKREIPVISDSYVELKFGTGIVKVTPAHDPSDFEAGLRHNLETINVINPDATMNEKAGKYKGMDRYVCRQVLLKDLQKAEYIVKVEDHQHAVGHCYRCNTAVEPHLSLQWFVKMKPLAEPAICAVKEGKIKFHPAHWTNTYFEWMDNIKDWCISRQIWWGHRLPVWYCKDCKEIHVSSTQIDTCKKCGGTKLYQDTDVLDTWFSSALWPFATLGWPQETPELKHFYPTSVLSTGFDIIFFWVARMTMFGLKFMGDVPFKEVYIHALVRDLEGAKMSKSRGNTIEPEIIIQKYGTDALRFTLTALAAQGRDIYLAEDRIEGYRNFTNKIWNAARFVCTNLSDFNPLEVKCEKLKLELSDRWIISRFNKVTNSMTQHLANYHFNEAAQSIYNFFWHEFCDWYIELAKPRLKKTGALFTHPNDVQLSKQTAQYVLYYVLNGALRLLHPIMPFITEEIWHGLPAHSESIMIATWPEIVKGEINDKAEEEMNLLIEVITAIRNMRSELQISPAKKIEAIFNVEDESTKKILEYNSSYLVEMAKLDRLLIAIKTDKPEDSAAIVVGRIIIYLLLSKIVDIEAQKNKLIKEIEKIKLGLEKLSARLSDEKFLQNAPVEVIGNDKKKQQEYIDKKTQLELHLQMLQKE
ncbi:MAG: valine--tRNA ligase [Candidatus Firestonebacteria bacterium]